MNDVWKPYVGFSLQRSSEIEIYTMFSFNKDVTILFCRNHGTFIRSLFRTCCACIKKKTVLFKEKKSDLNKCLKQIKYKITDITPHMRIYF